MLILVVIFLLIVLTVSRRLKGPLWALCLAWLICLAPIASGAVIYRYVVDTGYAYSITLIVFIGMFVAGYAFYEAARRPQPVPPRPTPADFRRSYDSVYPVALVCWWLAMIATAFNYIDFTLLGGAGLDDLAALRDTYANKRATSAFAQIASILTWACLLCYMFALFFRRELSRWRFVMMLIPIVGYFSLSVFSAGRQAAFQIMLVSVLLVIVTNIVRPAEPRRIDSGRRWLTPERLGIAAVSAAMIGYMGYVAVARNDGNISDDKAQLLMIIFEFHFAPAVEQITQAMGSGLRGAITEGVVYFSASPALFEPFLTIHWPQHYFGAMTFPLFFRQIEPLTGLSVTGGLTAKVDAINAIGVLGAGWATSMSSYLIDFGFAGTLVFLFLMGTYSAHAWRVALRFPSFYAVVIGILVLVNAIYMPLTPGVSDSNLVLLWLFCVAMHHRVYRVLMPTRSRVQAPA